MTPAPLGPTWTALTQGEGVEDDAGEGHAHQEPADTVGAEGANICCGSPRNC